MWLLGPSISWVLRYLERAIFGPSTWGILNIKLSKTSQSSDSGWRSNLWNIVSSSLMSQASLLLWRHGTLIGDNPYGKFAGCGRSQEMSWPRQTLKLGSLMLKWFILKGFERCYVDSGYWFTFQFYAKYCIILILPLLLFRTASVLTYTVQNFKNLFVCACLFVILSHSSVNFE